MKRVLSLLVCVLLLPLFGMGEELSIHDLMARQVSANSTFRFLLSGTASGQAPFFMDEAVWEVLQALCPHTQLEGSYTLSKAGETLGNAQLTLQMKQQETVLGEMLVSGRGDAFWLSGDLMGDDVLSVNRDTEMLFRDKTISLAAWGGALARDYLRIWPKESPSGAWPGLTDTLILSDTQEAAWKSQLTELSAPYLADVSAWMQKHTRVTVERLGEVRCTQSVLEASLADCAQAAQSLLTRFYQDDAMRALLAQVMTTAQQQAYLEEGMLPLFTKILSGLQGEDALRLARCYDMQGGLVSYALTLPFARGEVLSLSWENDEYALSGQMRDCSFALRLAAASEGVYSGAFSWTQGEHTVQGTYQLFTAFGEVVRDAVDGKRTQDSTLTLLITPEEGQAFPPQSVSITVAASAGASDTQAARWNAEMVWRDLSGDSALQLMLKTRTAAAITQREVPAPSLIFSEMTAQERGQLWTEMAMRLYQLLAPRTAGLTE